MRKHSREYDSYMKSDEWAQKREERLRIDGNKCALCGRPNGLQKDGVTPILQVHHIRYSNLGQEPMEDLISVCAKDHRLIHKYMAFVWNLQDGKAAGGEKIKLLPQLDITKRAFKKSAERKVK